MSRRPADSPSETLEVYALAAGRLPRRLRVGRLSLHVLFVGPVAVIAAPPRKRRSSAAAAIEDVLREHHDVVVELAARVDPLLPARFGSRVTAATVDAIIRPSLDRIVNALEHVRGRQQMTVRLIGPSPAAGSGDAPVTGTAYLAARRAAHSMPREAAPLRAAVDRFVDDERIQPGRGGVRATVFHLVARSSVDAYRAAVENSLASIAPWQAAVSGPWPAFAFAPELAG